MQGLWKTQAKSKKVGPHIQRCLVILSVGEQNAKVKWNKKLTGMSADDKKCGPGQPPEPHRTWFPAWRNDRFSPTALERSAAFAKAGCRSVTLRSPICNRQGWPAAPSCSEEQNGGIGRNARATSLRSRTFSGFPPGNSPSRITGCCWLCRIIRQAQELSRFADPTLMQIAAPRNTKDLSGCAETVEDVSSLWKAEEN
jgi:hypothetical protein